MGGLTDHLPPCATKAPKCHPPTPRMTETHWQRGCLGSKSPSGHGSPWMVLFLAVHLFTSCFPLTEAQDGGDDATTGPPASPVPMAPNNKVQPPLLTTKKVLATLHPTTKTATTLPLVASTWTPGTPSGSPNVSNRNGSGYPYAHAAAAIRPIPLSIRMEPNVSHIGGDLVLTPRGNMTGLTSCTWFRGNEKKSDPIMTYKLSPVSVTERNVSYSGRESIGKDCSLHIHNLSPGDSGIYTIKTNSVTWFGEGKIKVEITGLDLEGKKSGKLNFTAMIGISAGVIAVVLVVGGLTLYQTNVSERAAETAAPPTQPASASASRRASQTGKMSRRGSQKLGPKTKGHAK